MKRYFLGAAAAVAAVSPACAQGARGEEAAGNFQIEPIIDARLRYEAVDQGNLESEALTLRLRAGAQAQVGHFSLLAEAEGTAALASDYNAFPFPIASDQRRPQFAVVPDPENLELNRLQIHYSDGANKFTLGRQRINLDDQRWVGSVGWRQNEQTFDAVRGEIRAGPTNFDLTYAINQRTIFGEDAGPRSGLDGQFVFAGLSSRLGRIEGKLFAYLLDYDETVVLANSSQTYGGILSGTIPLGGSHNVNFRASYARQSDMGANPFDYAADYWSFEGGALLAGFRIVTGWEQLGSDNGRAVQTPMATLHKFNGWADLFLTTPVAGLEDLYVSVSRAFDGVRALPGLNLNLAFHQFDSAVGALDYGSEVDASVGFRAGPVAVLIKYADYEARSFGADTRKLWLQAEWTF